MLHLIRSNSNSNLSTFPVYILRYVNQNDSAYIEKVFSCGNDGIFSNVNPCILLLKEEHFLNVWDYGSLFNKINCPTVNQKKCNKGSNERYKKRFCLRCMVSFLNESLHICQGMCDKCDKCLEKVEDHLDCEYYEYELRGCICERYFTNQFCFESHKMNKLTGEFGSYCQFLAGLKNCDSCTRDFELTLKCKHFGKLIKATRNRSKDDEEVLVGSNFSGTSQQKYVKCGFCSGFYLKGSISHSCFLRESDSIFASLAHRLSTIKSHNVFYYDIESRLDNYYECKVEKARSN